MLPMAVMSEPKELSFMFHLILFQPQIPPNTGNIIRLCANSGAKLHLIAPLGFDLSEKACRRAGLDYHALAEVRLHENWDNFLQNCPAERLFAITKFGETRFDTPQFKAGDGFLFGSETTGLPEEVHAHFSSDKRLSIPMIEGNRSLNLANAASIIAYEAWRQCGFAAPR